MHFTYRLLGPEDIGAYRQVRLECLQNSPDFFGTRYEEEAKAPTLKFDRALAETGGRDFLYGAFANGSLVGICGFSQGDRPKTRHRGELSQMYVNPQFARQGIGARLLELTIGRAEQVNGVELITLAVVDTNLGAIALYQKAGFVAYGHLPGYFRLGGQAWGVVDMALHPARARGDGR